MDFSSSITKLLDLPSLEKLGLLEFLDTEASREGVGKSEDGRDLIAALERRKIEIVFGDEGGI